MTWVKQTALLFAFSVWEYWLGKTEKLVASSTWELLLMGLSRLTKGRIKMEDKELAQGNLGDVKLTLKDGVARLEAAGQAPGDAGVKAGAFIECDSSKLLDKLFAAVEAHSPAGVVAIEEGVKAILKAAVAKV